MTAREQILDDLKRLTGAPAASQDGGAVSPPFSPRANVSARELQELFLDRCGRSRATSSIVESRRAVPEAIGAYLSEQNFAEQLIVGESLNDLDWSAFVRIEETMERLMGDGLSVVTDAQFAVAETGSIVAMSSSACDSRLNFLAETHFAVLSVASIVATPEDVWRSLRGGKDVVDMPRAVSFITGPSRTADIEQTIELGAHGPRRLHVILVED